MSDAEFSCHQSTIKDGWSKLTALHTVLLPDKVREIGNPVFNAPMVEILSRRWQDRCQEVSDTAMYNNVIRTKVVL